MLCAWWVGDEKMLNFLLWFHQKHHSIFEVFIFGYVNFLRMKRQTNMMQSKNKIRYIFVCVYNKLSSLDPGMLVWRSPKIILHGKSRKIILHFFFCNSTEIYGIQSVCRTDTITHIPYIGNGNSTNMLVEKERNTHNLYWILFMHAHHFHPWFSLCVFFLSLCAAKYRQKARRHFQAQTWMLKWNVLGMATCMWKRKEKRKKKRRERPYNSHRKKSFELKQTTKRNQRYFSHTYTIKNAHNFPLFLLTVCVYSFFSFISLLMLRRRREKKMPTTTTHCNHVFRFKEKKHFTLLSLSFFLLLWVERLKNCLLCPYSIWIFPSIYFFRLSVQHTHLCLSLSQFSKSLFLSLFPSLSVFLFLHSSFSYFSFGFVLPFAKCTHGCYVKYAINTRIS